MIAPLTFTPQPMHPIIRTVLPAIVAIWTLSEVACAASVDLGGTDHTGYAAALGFNPEPNGIDVPGGKSSFGMPYYFDTATNYWTYLVTTPLSPTNDYSSLGVGTVSGTASSDVSFGTTNFGSFNYNDGAFTGTGIETISITGGDFIFSLADMSPMNAFYGRTNYNTLSNNEFFWDYAVLSVVGNVDLTFTNGTLTSMDGTLDIGVAIRFSGVDDGTFSSTPLDFDPLTGSIIGTPASYDGSLTFSGDQFTFELDATIGTVYSFLGTLTDTRLVINRTGSIDAVQAVPEPSSVALVGLGLSVLLMRRRSRNQKRP